ncbi:hypothetical protein GGS21DRAFT_266718 [Xylaria nigripes]|nr:hypothetical protein GGS21DRAFT_266718 [Xylaria nigripes]
MLNKLEALRRRPAAAKGEGGEKSPGGEYEVFKRHMARYWLWYGIVLIVFLAIFLPLLFLKIIPVIAQLVVDRTGLPIYDGVVQLVGHDSFLLSLRTTMVVPNGVSVRMSPMTVSVYSKNTTKYTPFLTIPISGRTMKGHAEIAITNDMVHVEDQAEFNKWLRTALTQNETKLSIKASTNAYLGILKNHITIRKTIELPALRELQGASITNVTIVLPPAADGANVIGHIMLPNWSEVTLRLGNITLNVWADDILVANADLVDVYLVPGNNTLPFHGRFYPGNIIGSFEDIIASQSDSIVRGKIALWVNGNTTTVDGEHITYIEDALRSAHITVEIPVIRLLADIADSLLSGNLTLLGIGDLVADGLLGGASNSNLSSDFLDHLIYNLAHDDVVGNLLHRFDLTRAQRSVLEHSVKLLGYS